MPKVGTSTKESELPSFPNIKVHERRAVILRAEGKTYEQITAHINDEFALNFSIDTVKEWFYAGGRLLQAYHEYIEADAAMSLKEARQAIKRSTKAAAANLIEKMDSSDERVSLDATKALLNKYIPDKQVVMDTPEADPDIPEELQQVANSLKEGEDGPQPVDEPPVGEPDSQAPGA